MPAETVAHMFSDYGDFFLYKASLNSCFVEFSYLDPSFVPD